MFCVCIGKLKCLASAKTLVNKPHCSSKALASINFVDFPCNVELLEVTCCINNIL